jgi:hypothetical protein
VDNADTAVRHSNDPKDQQIAGLQDQVDELQGRRLEKLMMMLEGLVRVK